MDISKLDVSINGARVEIINRTLKAVEIKDSQISYWTKNDKGNDIVFYNLSGTYSKTILPHESYLIICYEYFICNHLPSMDTEYEVYLVIEEHNIKEYIGTYIKSEDLK